MRVNHWNSPVEGRATPGAFPPRDAPRAPAAGGPYPYLKRAFDLLFALVLLVPAVPVILVSALVVRLTSRGPAFYSQIRLGKNGKPFRIYKIRTMVADSERDGACWSRPGDPRVTRVGRFLRRTHLDELPQLWNVIAGEMSLVGPRPERPEFVPSLEHAVSRYRDRLQVRPGLTGLAQVQLPPDSDLESVRRKLACDLYYIGHVSLWLDLRLMIATAFYLVNQSCVRACRWLRVPGGAPVEEYYERLVRERSQGSLPPVPADVAPLGVPQTI